MLADGGATVLAAELYAGDITDVGQFPFRCEHGTGKLGAGAGVGQRGGANAVRRGKRTRSMTSLSLKRVGRRCSPTSSLRCAYHSDDRTCRTLGSVRGTLKANDLGVGRGCLSLGSLRRTFKANDLLSGPVFVAWFVVVFVLGDVGAVNVGRGRAGTGSG